MTGWPSVEALKIAIPSHYQEFYMWVFLNQPDWELKVTQQKCGCSGKWSLTHQIHPETNCAAQQVSRFSSTVTTPCNPDFTLSYGESGSPSVACVVERARPATPFQLSLWAVCEPDPGTSFQLSLWAMSEPDSATFFQWSGCAVFWAKLSCLFPSWAPVPRVVSHVFKTQKVWGRIYMKRRHLNLSVQALTYTTTV